MPPRLISFLPQARERLLVWSDASYEDGIGELGFVIFDPELAGRLPSAMPPIVLPFLHQHPSSLEPCSGFLYGAGILPQALHDLLVPKKQQIGQCELTAAIATYMSIPDLFKGRDVLHWIDNTSAIACLLHGYSSKPDSARLTNVFHLFNASLRANVYFEYVESKANIADLPSRGDFELLRAMAAIRIPMILPSAEEWARPLRYWLVRSAARLRTRSFVQGHKRGRSTS